jgi:hypothetical protein
MLGSNGNTQIGKRKLSDKVFKFIFNLLNNYLTLPSSKTSSSTAATSTDA